MTINTIQRDLAVLRRLHAIEVKCGRFKNADKLNKGITELERQEALLEISISMTIDEIHTKNNHSHGDQNHYCSVCAMIAAGRYRKEKREKKS